MTELEVLLRAHQLFSTSVLPSAPLASDRVLIPAVDGGSRALDAYRARLQAVVLAQRAAAATDSALGEVLSGAERDHARARSLTRGVLEEARRDTGGAVDSPVAQREALRRAAARMRAQHGHVLMARSRAALRLAVLRALRYRVMQRLRLTGGAPLAPGDNRAAVAVRAALSRLGRPYVWGATGPDRFDCSGLVQWAYRQAGVQIDRTTYDQIDDGIAVPRSQIRPGDLVFPHSGHVQMAIGNGMVVEAPYTGATVRVSPLGDNVVIRRPLA
ncbi:C40 family peptidase [Mycobacterium sp. ACS4331]|uniref:C40 family peptidase n=1 Tax=Mycobacterium sp. ACS4331 TaxID=1834121 RepID=UPI0007FEE2BC|nr:C40 family peptidase [Mycobacterium sp. ACS4331]OBF25928.1 hypothetical protein A5727_03785 [Mycobacterium sp. ACS4331]